MLIVDESVENRTLCDVFGVASMGGIRVNKSRNLAVLISNNTDPTYSNEWRDGVLHFVGMGSIGPQKLDRQNRTLANSKKHGMTIHLFEVFEKSRYVYAGEVELAEEPYMSDQPDARAEARFVWIFPLRKKQTRDRASKPSALDAVSRLADHLPYGAYAVIGAGLRDDQVRVVNEALDRMKEAGIMVVDQRDIDRHRYEAALERWHERYLDHARSIVKALIAKRHGTKATNRKAALVDDELKIDSSTTENELRQVLKLFLDREDPIGTQEVFDEALRAVPMPEMPKSLEESITADPMDVADLPDQHVRRIDRSKLKDFT